MKPLFENLQPGPESSFIVRSFDLEKFTVPFHFHPEYELTLILKGRGKRYVGNNMADFDENDLVLIGPDLPHCWKSEKEDGVKSVVVHFINDFLGKDFFDKPELSGIQNILKRSASGIRFTGKIAENAVPKMELLSVEENPFRKMLRLLDVMEDLAGSSEYQLLDHGGTVAQLPHINKERMNSALGYIVDNFRSGIILNEVAAEVNMSPNAFCKYFKKATNKTFMETVIDYRINFAMQQLLSTEKPVAEIAMESGFGDVSHFYKLFKRLIRISPLQYRKDFQKGI
ncbi:AraC family transcriptional regulator [Dyadobacter frigoris]|uniref:Helix-turn-helix domain-containing protein n=1 Tax=Dyadobacter frigoris TaxID=2576211 RepID=A0A4U6CXK4_9BACT|nr:AraC family transcriptional regulator [Dyadobacter frigoris]TKT89422.1 helix-turn-helix domain-containing protein [Dyadobacter frigoris]GLU55436.1 AraC family transcriptional regulator [Dyadobacter frigoris]